MKTIKESIIGRRGQDAQLYVLYLRDDDFSAARDYISDDYTFITPMNAVLYCIDKFELDKFLKILRQQKGIKNDKYRVINNSSSIYRVTNGFSRDQITKLLKDINPLRNPYDKLKELTRIA